MDAKGRPLHSWRTLILPYLEQEPLYQTIDLSKPWNDPANARALETSLSVFRCPEAVGPQNTTTYLAIAAPNGCLIPGEPRRLAEITDAHASTLMVIEAGEENAVPWMAPVDADESLVMSLGPTTKLHHAGGMNACFVDGSVMFLKASTPAAVRRALMSISGNDDRVARVVIGPAIRRSSPTSADRPRSAAWPLGRARDRISPRPLASSKAASGTSQLIQVARGSTHGAVTPVTVASPPISLSTTAEHNKR